MQHVGQWNGTQRVLVRIICTGHFVPLEVSWTSENFRLRTNHRSHTQSEVSVFCYMMPCGMAYRLRRFGEACCLSVQGITRIFLVWYSRHTSFLQHSVKGRNFGSGVSEKVNILFICSYVFNPSRGIEISFVVFKSVSWYLNSSRGIPTRNVVFKSGSRYSNSSRGIQIRLVAFKFVSWWANSS